MRIANDAAADDVDDDYDDGDDGKNDRIKYGMFDDQHFSFRFTKVFIIWFGEMICSYSQPR